MQKNVTFWTEKNGVPNPAKNQEIADSHVKYDRIRGRMGYS